MAVVVGANRQDSRLLAPTLDTVQRLGPLPARPTVHLDRGYDSGKTRDLLADRGMTGEIAQKSKPVPIQADQRWPVERTSCLGQPVQEAGLEHRTL